MDHGELQESGARRSGADLDRSAGQWRARNDASTATVEAALHLKSFVQLASFALSAKRSD